MNIPDLSHEVRSRDTGNLLGWLILEELPLEPTNFSLMCGSYHPVPCRFTTVTVEGVNPRWAVTVSERDIATLRLCDTFHEYRKPMLAAIGAAATPEESCFEQRREDEQEDQFPGGGLRPSEFWIAKSRLTTPPPGVNFRWQIELAMVVRNLRR